MQLQPAVRGALQSFCATWSIASIWLRTWPLCKLIMDAPPGMQEVSYAYLYDYCKRLSQTLPKFDQKGYLYEEVQQIVINSSNKTEELRTVRKPVDGVNPLQWPDWIVPGPNPSILLSSKREDWWIWKIKLAVWHPRLFWFRYFKRFNKVRCPDCRQDCNVIGDGFATKLRAVCSHDRTIYILDYRYKCVGCPSKWQTPLHSCSITYKVRADVCLLRFGMTSTCIVPSVLATCLHSS